MISRSFNIYRVSCETYDKAWIVCAVNKVKARKLVKEMTEELGWHLDYPEEKRTWEVEQVLNKSGLIVETSDI